MNSEDFLSQVEDLAEECTEEQLRHFVYECARTTPEEKRYAFLQQLQTAAAGGADAQGSAEKQDPVSLEEACADMIEVLDDIEAGVRTVQMEINESDWYSSDEEFLFEDPEHIMADVEKACDLVHRCAQEKDYQNALALGNGLAHLTIIVSNEYCDDLNVWAAANVLNCGLDLRTLQLDTMTAAYYASSQRCEDIYFCMTSHSQLMLKDLLEYTEEGLPDFPTFLEEWVSFLGETQGAWYQLDDLYQEALTMLPDSEARISYVRQFAQRHPEGYRFLLKDAGIPDEKRWELGLEALEKIQGETPLRAGLAIQTAEIAVRTGKPQADLETCWMEAFAADPSAVDYLRAYLHASDPKAAKEKLDSIVAACRKKAAAENGDQWYSWRSLSPMFQFLRGDAVNAFRSVVRNDNWNWDSFASGCACLCLAALYQEVPKTKIMRGVYGKAREALSFGKTSYLRGVPQSAIQDLENAQPQLKLQGQQELDEDQLFLLCFRQWETQTVSFSDEEAQEILSSIERSMERQMTGSATADMAGHYGDFAFFLAAVGEVRESLGQAGAKQQILSRVGNAYRRRRNFIAELLNCGWNGR